MSDKAGANVAMHIEAFKRTDCLTCCKITDILFSPAASRSTPTKPKESPDSVQLFWFALHGALQNYERGVPVADGSSLGRKFTKLARQKTGIANGTRKGGLSLLVQSPIKF